jgi:argininosuccinate synthase
MKSSAWRKRRWPPAPASVYIEDLRLEFLTDYVFPTMQAGAIYERDYLLGTSFARPLIAKKLVEIAELEGADAVAHGATGKGNDQVRFELTVMALNPKLRIIAPWREWTIRGRRDALDYAAEHNVPVKATMERIYSQDKNLWHLSNEGGPLEDPWNEPPKDMFEWTTTRLTRPTRRNMSKSTSARACRSASTAWRMGRWASCRRSTRSALRHGIGRVDIVENRLVGMKSHGVYETPGGTLLYKGHAALEQLCLDKETLHFKQQVGLKFAELVYNGQWFTPLREALTPVRQLHRAEHHRHGAAEALQGQRHPGRAQESATASTAKITSPSTRTTSTTRPTPRASSSSLACR